MSALAEWAGSALDKRCFGLFDSFAKSISQGSVTFALPDGTEAVYGVPPTEAGLDAARARDAGGELHAWVKVHSLHAFTRIVFSQDIGLGEAYMHSELDCEHPTRLLKILCQNATALNGGSQNETVMAWATYLGQGLAQLEHVLHANTLAGSKRNISAHYDVGNKMYKAFLDETMTYSCGYFATPDDSLHQAQLNKLDKIIAAAGIADGDSVLEIGSGWGSMAIRTAQKFPNVTFTSLTVSEEQRLEAVARVEALGLADRVQILFRDYREFVDEEKAGTFDAVVSIEMIEAVGHENLPGYFAVLAKAVRPGGKVAIQAITIPDDRYDTYRKGGDFIRKYIFPGGHLPSDAAMEWAGAELAGMTRVATENIGPHYATTLKAWHDNFVSEDAGIKADTTDVFFKCWRFYFAYCEAAFATDYLKVLHVTFERPMTPSAGEGAATAATDAASDDKVAIHTTWGQEATAIGQTLLTLAQSWYWSGTTNARKIAPQR